MMQTIVYFRDINALSHPITCQNVLRIPEVFLRLREAQDIVEHGETLDEVKSLFYHLSIGEFPRKSIPNHLWHKMMTVIQLGLCDRYLKSQNQPPLFMAQILSCQAAQISSGLLTLKKMLQSPHLPEQTCFYEGSKESRELHHLVLFKPIKDNGQITYQQLSSHIKTSTDLIEYAQNHQISQMVVIGPAERLAVSSQDFQLEEDKWLSEIANSAILSDQIQIIESIDLDPLLFWFWRDYSKTVGREFLHKNP